MMRLFWFLFLYLISSCTHAACNETVKNINDKFEYSNLVIDTIVSYQKNIQEISKDYSRDVVERMVAHKKFIADMDCSLKKFLKFNKTNKSTIKQSLPKATNYLNHLIKWNKDTIEIINYDDSKSREVLNDKMSNSILDAKELKTELLDFSSIIYTSVKFENSDKPNIKVVDKDEIKKYLGITNLQRATLIQNTLSKLSSEEKDAGFLYNVFMPIQLLSFENKEILGLEEIGMR